MMIVQVHIRSFSSVESFSFVENDDDKTTKTYDHDHGATITIDVHNILEIFKEQIHQTEERILAAIQHEQSKNIPKSYRTADRF